MDETEWLAGNDLERMLRFALDRMSPRKRRLYGCACCCLTWDLLLDERNRKAVKVAKRAVEVAERFADGQANEEELAAAGLAAQNALFSTRPVFQENPLRVLVPRWIPAAVVQSAQFVTRSQFELLDIARPLAYALAWVGEHFPETLDEAVDEEEETRLLNEWEARLWNERVAKKHQTVLAQECALLRDVVGNPFRPVILDPSWLRWNDGCIPKIAQAIYDEHRFEDLPILADALENAGCDNEDILAHCRSAGPHVRGCWVVDAILGKE